VPADVLTTNLAALDRMQRQLAQRLRWPVDGSHVVPLESGALGYRVHHAVVPLGLDAAQVSATLEPVTSADAFLFGAGLGELAFEWLRGDDRTLVVWDRDPWLLRLMLSARDVSRFIANKRLRLSLGVDLLQRDVKLPVLLHPMLGAVYRQERRLLEADPTRPLVFLGAGGLFVNDVADALGDLGHRVYSLDVQRLSPEECTHAVRTARPGCFLGINHVEGFADFCEAERLPNLTWEIDPAMTSVAKAEVPTTRTRVFTWRKANVSEFHAQGYQATHLPLAANPRHRAPVHLSPEQRQRYQVPVAFVGASMADRTPSLRQQFLEAFTAFRPGQRAEGQRVLDEVLAAQRTDFSSYRVPQLLQARVPDWAVRAGDVVPERVLGELAAAERRLAFVQALIPHRIAVWGDLGWQQVPGLDYRGPAGHEVELNAVYSGAAITIDLGRLYQLDIVTMRVFDALACGGFVLAEYCDDLRALFELGVEVESWKTLPELTEKTTHYLAHPEQARAIALAGQRAVRERHTIQARVRTMLSTVRV